MNLFHLYNNLDVIATTFIIKLKKKRETISKCYSKKGKCKISGDISGNDAKNPGEKFFVAMLNRKKLTTPKPK